MQQSAMAGHASVVEEEWLRSVDHLRDMARQNEESLLKNKRLTSVLSVPNRELIDGIEHVVPALDERRAAWAKDIAFQRRLLDERFSRIDQSREDVVHFQDIGMNSTEDEEHERRVEAAAAARMLKRRGKGNKAPKVLGVLELLRVKTGGGASTSVLAPPPDLLQHKKKPKLHDGKAAEALTRMKQRRNEEFIEAKVCREREAAEALVRKEEGERLSHEEEEARRNNTVKSRAARAAAAMAKMRKVGREVAMGRKVATAVQDNSAEASAAREAERAQQEASEQLIAAAEALEAEENEASRQSREMRELRDKLSHAQAAADDATRMALHAEEIITDLIEDGQEDAAEMASQTVEAWRARSIALKAEAGGMRAEYEALEERYGLAEGRRAQAEAQLESQNHLLNVLKGDVLEKDSEADVARAARAKVMVHIANEVISYIYSAEANDDRQAVTEIVGAAAELGVMSDAAETFVSRIDEASERASDTVAASLAAAHAANKAAVAEVSARSDLAAAQKNADEARDRLRSALTEMYAASSNSAAGCEVTLAHDASASSAKRLVAVVGAPMMSAIFIPGKTRVCKVKGGFNLIGAKVPAGEERESPPEDLINLLSLALPPAPREGEYNLEELVTERVKATKRGVESTKSVIQASTLAKRTKKLAAVAKKLGLVSEEAGDANPAFVTSVFKPPGSQSAKPKPKAISTVDRAPKAAAKKAADVKLEPLVRVRVAVERFNRAHFTASRAEEAVRAALDDLVSAFETAPVKRRDADTFATRAELFEIRRVMVERVFLVGVRQMAEVQPRITRLQQTSVDPREATMALLEASNSAYGAVAVEAEVVVGEYRGKMKAATAALSDAEKSVAAALDALSEAEAAERIAKDEHLAAKDRRARGETRLKNLLQVMKEDKGIIWKVEIDAPKVDAAKEAVEALREVELSASLASKEATKKIEKARQAIPEAEAFIPPAAVAREHASRVLASIEEERDDIRRLVSAALTALKLDAEGERLAIIAKDAAAEAAVAGESDADIHRLAVEAATAASKSISEAAQERAVEAAEAATAANADIAAADAEVVSCKAAVEAREADLALAKYEMTRARDEERRNLAAEREAKIAEPVAKQTKPSPEKPKRQVKNPRALARFRMAVRLVIASIAFVTPAQRAAAEVAELRRKIVEAERYLEAAIDDAEYARRKAKIAERHCEDARRGAAALRERANAITERESRDKKRASKATFVRKVSDVDSLADSLLAEKHAEEAVQRVTETLDAARDAAAAAKSSVEQTSQAVRDAESTLESARSDLGEKRDAGALAEADARFAESHATAEKLRAEGPGLEAAVAAADEAATNAMELRDELRRVHEDHERRVKRAAGTLRAAREMPEASTQRHTAELKRLHDAERALKSARKVLAEATKLREKAEDKAAKEAERRRRMAELDKKARQRKREKTVKASDIVADDNSSRAVDDSRQMKQPELTELDVEVIHRMFEEADASEAEGMREKHRDDEAAMKHGHSKEMYTLADWHRRGGGAAPRHLSRRKHEPGKMVDTLMQNFKEDVFRGGSVATRFEGGNSFGPPPDHAVDKVLRRQMMSRGDWLPEMDDQDKPPGVATNELARRHAEETKAAGQARREEQRRHVASREARKEDFIRKASEERKREKLEAVKALLGRQ